MAPGAQETEKTLGSHAGSIAVERAGVISQHLKIC